MIGITKNANTRDLAWTFNPAGATKEEQRGEGDGVQVTLISFAEHKQSLGHVILKPGERHGRVKTPDSCYYYCLSGVAVFGLYENDECIKTETLTACSAIRVEAESEIDYSALDSGAELVLFRNYA